MPTFSPGQRWISDTETDLGLGTILKTEHRLITIVYMASGEIRTYSAETAPLTRVIFGAGDRIKSADNREIIVTDLEEVDGLVVYYGTSEDGSEVTLSETQLDNFTQFNRPSDKLLNGQFDNDRRYHIRLQSREMQQQLVRSQVFGLCGARAELIPHQLYIANEVANRLNPRVLLADEVGLGKTIEAGLILHQQLTRGTISRVLVIVPEPLLHQWLVEMRRRFNLKFSIIDDMIYEESLESATEGNPFLDRQLVLTTLPFLLSEPEIQDHALNAEWDTLIVDEAHHLETPQANDSNPESSPYGCVAALAAKIPSLLLLTATPEQLGNTGHFARLQLLDPHRFPSLDQFRDEEANYRTMADIATTLLEDKPLPAELQKHLDTLEISADTNSGIVSEMIDLHGTGRVMFRNTRSAVSGFPERIHEPYLLKSGTVTDWLGDKLAELSPNKVLLICKSVKRVESLKETLRTKFGIHAAVFHEEMSIVDRDSAAEYFADEENGSQILLCSEIGSEGRNFQFLHHLILIDLPDNADLLEQRIGRLDRIGQTQTIKILVPCLKDSADEFLQRWYHDGLNAFEQTCQVGQQVKADLLERFTQALNGDLDVAELNTLIDDATSLADKKREQIEQGRDRLLELSSHREVVSTPVIEEIVSYDSDNTLKNYMDHALDNLGVEIEDQSAHTYIITPGEHLAVSEFPGLPDEGTTITFRRHVALAREDVQFLSWEHPLVQTAMEQIISGGFGQVLVGAMQDESLVRGSVLLEAHYVFDCPAPKNLAVEQYMNGELLRVVLTEACEDMTDHFSRDDLDQAFHSIKKPLAKQLVSVKRPQLQQQLTRAEETANNAVKALKKQAVNNAKQTLGGELERLKQLSLRNKSVRADELEGLQTQLDDTLRALSQLRCVLDLVRVFGIA